jgi:hypothetical protein
MMEAVRETTAEIPTISADYRFPYRTYRSYREKQMIPTICDALSEQRGRSAWLRMPGVVLRQVSSMVAQPFGAT